jgi:hypothetical protein
MWLHDRHSRQVLACLLTLAFVLTTAQATRSSAPDSGASDPRRTSQAESATGTDGVWVQDPPPSARYLHTSVYDPVHDRMVVFGGFARGYDLVNDVWVLSMAGSPAWTRLDPTGTPPSGRHLHSAIYDPVRNRVVIFGGYQRSQPAFLNDVWALTLGDNPTWERLAPVGVAPAVREGHTAIYDSGHDRMIVFGGYQYSGYRGATAGPLNDVWALSLSGSPAWSQVSAAGTLPAPRSAHSAIYDPMHRTMVIFGGFGGGLLNDAWELKLEGNPRWTEITPAGTTPAPRLAHASIYDPAGRRMVVFEGTVNASGPAAGDVWALSLTGRPEWSLITPAGAQPSVRSGASAIYDPMRLRAVIFGGTPDGFGLLSDVWGITLAGGGVWANLTPPGTPPGRFASAIYDPVRGRMVALGGNGEVWARSLAGSLTWTLMVAPGTPPNPPTVGSPIYDPERDRIVVFGGSTDHLDPNNDVWALPLSGKSAWVQLQPAGVPPAVREGHTAIYDPVRDRMVVYAGVNSQYYLGDLWALSLAGDPSWTHLAPTGALPNSRLGHSAIYDPVRDRMIVFGGLNGVYFLCGPTGVDETRPHRKAAAPERRAHCVLRSGPRSHGGLRPAQ